MKIDAMIICEGEPVPEQIFSDGRPTGEQKTRDGLPLWKVPVSVGLSGIKAPISSIKVTSPEKPNIIFGTTMVVHGLRMGTYNGNLWLTGDFDQEATDRYRENR